MRKSKKTALLRLTTIATALKSILSVAALVPITAMGLPLAVLVPKPSALLLTAVAAQQKEMKQIINLSKVIMFHK